MKNGSFQVTIFTIIFFIVTSMVFILFSSDRSLLALTYNGKTQNVCNKSQTIESTKIFSGCFYSRNDNLGIVSLGLNTRPPLFSGNVTFRLKEVGQEKWLYENKYNSAEFSEISLYPFGFPIIRNSKGNSYQYEIISEIPINSNNNLNAIQTTTTYVFSKDSFISGRESLLEFASNKIIYGFGFWENIKYILLFLFPFLTYSFYLLLKKMGLSVALVKYLPKTIRSDLSEIKNELSKLILDSFLLLILIVATVDIVFLRESSDIILVIGFIFWIIYIIKNHVKSKISFLLATFLLISQLFFILFRYELIVNKISSWIYCALTVGVIHALYEMKTHEKK